MSQENVKTVLAFVKSYNASDIDRMLNEFCTADVEAVPDRSVFPEAEPLHGRDALGEWAREIGSAWGEARWEVRDARALEADRVLVRGDWGGTGRGSGLDIASNFSGVFSLRDNRISRIMFFRDHPEALKAVGLEE